MQKLSGTIVRMLHFEVKAGLKITYSVIGIFRKKFKLHELLYFMDTTIASIKKRD